MHQANEQSCRHSGKGNYARLHCMVCNLTFSDSYVMKEHLDSNEHKWRELSDPSEMQRIKLLSSGQNNQMVANFTCNVGSSVPFISYFFYNFFFFVRYVVFVAMDQHHWPNILLDILKG